MAKRTSRFIGLMLTFLAANLAQAQNETPMADLMRSNGKIYVVVAVIAIIFAGIIVYLVSIDRKTAYLEEELKNLQK